MFETLQFCDVDSLQKNAADLLAGQISSVLDRKDIVLFGICGGRSVAGVFAHLRTRNVPWGRVHIFFVDERCVPLDSPDSNFRLAYDSFLSELVHAGLISKSNLHPFVSGTDLPSRAEEYSRELCEFGSGFDLILLSMGEDGHIASLFPHHASIRDDSSEYFIAVENAPKAPSLRVSASKKLLKRAGFSILMAVGKGKAQALEMLGDEVYNEEICPAKIVKSITSGYLLTDIM